MTVFREGVKEDWTSKRCLDYLLVLASKPRRTENLTMQDLEDAGVDEELETMMYIGQDYLLRVVDVLKPERIIEIEVEVLVLRSSTLR